MREIRLWIGRRWVLGLFRRTHGVCLGVSFHWGRWPSLQIDLLILIVQVSWRS